MKVKVLFLVVDTNGEINVHPISERDDNQCVTYTGLTEDDDKLLSRLGYSRNDNTEISLDQEAWDLPYKLGNTTVYIEEHEVDVPIGISRTINNYEDQI